MRIYNITVNSGRLLRGMITAKIKFGNLLCRFSMRFLMFSLMFLMLWIAVLTFNLFTVMFTKKPLLVSCSCIRLYVMNYVCIVPHGITRNFDAKIRVYAIHDLYRLRTKYHQLTLYSNVICCLLGVGFLCFVVVIGIDLRTLMRRRKHFVVAIHPRSSEFFEFPEFSTDS